MVNSVRLNTLINFYLIFPFYFVYTTLIVYLNRKLLKKKKVESRTNHYEKALYTSCFYHARLCDTNGPFGLRWRKKE